MIITSTQKQLVDQAIASHAAAGLAQAKLDSALATRDTAIVAALEAGVTQDELAEALTAAVPQRRMTRSAVYYIARKARRRA